MSSELRHSAYITRPADRDSVTKWPRTPDNVALPLTNALRRILDRASFRRSRMTSYVVLGTSGISQHLFPRYGAMK
jgi:hypothetical protein